MGADISVDGKVAVIEGEIRLVGDLCHILSNILS
jgi:hypothetical protein